MGVSQGVPGVDRVGTWDSRKILKLSWSSLLAHSGSSRGWSCCSASWEQNRLCCPETGPYQAGWMPGQGRWWISHCSWAKQGRDSWGWTPPAWGAGESFIYPPFISGWQNVLCWTHLSPFPALLSLCHFNFASAPVNWFMELDLEIKTFSAPLVFVVKCWVSAQHHKNNKATEQYPSLKVLKWSKVWLISSNIDG